MGVFSIKNARYVTLATAILVGTSLPATPPPPPAPEDQEIDNQIGRLKPFVGTWEGMTDDGHNILEIRIGHLPEDTNLYIYISLLNVQFSVRDRPFGKYAMKTGYLVQYSPAHKVFLAYPMGWGSQFIRGFDSRGWGTADEVLVPIAVILGSNDRVLSLNRRTVSGQTETVTLSLKQQAAMAFATTGNCASPGCLSGENLARTGPSEWNFPTGK